MIFLKLFIGFLVVGLFSFGGAYGSIPLIKEVVMYFSWLSEDELTNMIAISESTPGPIMVNLATYIGTSQGGVLGAFIATFAVVLPAFIIILLVMIIFKKLIKNKYFQVILDGLQASIIGIILSTGVLIIFNAISISEEQFSLNIYGLIIAFILYGIIIGFKVFFKKRVSPIILIAVSAVLGILLL